MTQPITVIFNGGSGSAKEDSTRERILTRLEGSGRTIELVQIGDHDEASLASIIIRTAENDGIVVAAGGDGTINAVAHACYLHKATMGIIPLGTFNYFARDNDIPTDLDAALDTVLTGEPVNVAAGFVEERLFLNNASFGLYATLIKNRENDTSRFGRYRFIAFLSALRTLFGKSRLFTIQLARNGIYETHKAAMLFVGNNPLQLANVGLDNAAHSAKHRLAVVLVKPLNRWQMAKLILRGVTRSLTRAEQVEEYGANEFQLQTKRKTIHAVLDGEIMRLRTPLAFRIEAEALSLIVPRVKPEPPKA